MSGRRRKLLRILEAAERGEAVPMQAGYWLAHEHHRWRRMLEDGTLGFVPLALLASLGPAGSVEFRVRVHFVARVMGWV